MELKLILIIIGGIIIAILIMRDIVQKYQKRATFAEQELIKEYKTSAEYRSAIESMSVEIRKLKYKPPTVTIETEGADRTIKQLDRLMKKIDSLRGEMEQDSPEDGHVVSVTGGDPCNGIYTRTKRVYDYNTKNVRTIATEDRPMTDEEFNNKTLAIGTGDLLYDKPDKVKTVADHWHDADFLKEMVDAVTIPCMNDYDAEELRKSIEFVVKDYAESELQQLANQIEGFEIKFNGVKNADEMNVTKLKPRVKEIMGYKVIEDETMKDREIKMVNK